MLEPYVFLIIMVLTAFTGIFVMPCIFNWIRRRGAPWCPTCKWARLDFISLDEAAAYLSERGIPKEVACQRLMESSAFKAGPSGMPLIWRCRKCKTFWEMGHFKGGVHERSEDLHPPRLP